MNNDNNNLNGQVLGSVNNTNDLGNQMPVSNELETLETLDTNIVNNGDINNTIGTSTSNQNNVDSPQPISPEPAYTNPQAINPMPGFENSNTIGTTPPISLEPEQQPKKKKTNKTLFVVIIIVLLFGVGFGTYYVLNYTDLLSNKSKIEIELKNIEINAGDTLSTNITDYANITGTDVRNCLLDTSNIDVKAEGTYNYKVTCGDIIKTGEVKVIDNRELEIETQKVYKVNGDTIEAKEFIVNPDNTYTYEFVNKEEVDSYLNSTNGNYQVKIKVTSGTKVKEVEETLVILEHRIIGYLTCKSKEQSLSNSSTKKIISNKFALVNDGNFGFGNIAYETYEFKFSDETEYSNYLANYKTNNTITIDNITGTVEFNDNELTISISNELSENDLKTKYNGIELTNYSNIKKYFIDTLGYECTYKKETQN